MVLAELKIFHQATSANYGGNCFTHEILTCALAIAAIVFAVPRDSGLRSGAGDQAAGVDINLNLEVANASVAFIAQGRTIFAALQGIDKVGRCGSANRARSRSTARARPLAEGGRCAENCHHQCAQRQGPDFGEHLALVLLIYSVIDEIARDKIGLG